MQRVAEIIYIVESEREEFLKNAINPDHETLQALWECGVRKQQYFGMNDLIFMTFEYKGSDFHGDMEKMADYLRAHGNLVEKRRKDVPVEERETTNWWAPVKKLGTLLDVKPEMDDADEIEWQSWSSMRDGSTSHEQMQNDIAFDEDDWTESIHI